MPLFPYGSYIALGFLALVIGLMAYFPDTRVALIIGPGWLVFLVVVYYLMGFNKTKGESIGRPVSQTL